MLWHWDMGEERALSLFLQVCGIRRPRSLPHLHYYAGAIVFWWQSRRSVQLHFNTAARVLPCPEHFSICVFQGAEQRLTIVSITVMELFNYMKWKSRYSPDKQSFPDDAHTIYSRVKESTWIIFRALSQYILQTASGQHLVTVRCFSIPLWHAGAAINGCFRSINR
jgi:hypothetical protein